ncbi:MAG TPA: 5,10-methylenetetrahydrofolate reductase [Nitrospirae bacterium]|nr:5,10-methylenetetrahydrofolate reductase [Nitrospirota bacterium]
MIITKKRDFQELLDNIRDYKSFFLIGCSECASLCGTGGENEVKELAEALRAEGKEVTGGIVAKTGCQVLGTKKELKAYKDAVNSAECILVMSCGAGTQSAVELFGDKPVYPTNDSLFLGNMTRFQVFDERCSMCGDCILDKTGGICPITTCPKGLLNGPCGGMKDGRCEVSPDIPCAWVRIYERMKKLDKLDELAESVIEVKDWSTAQSPRALSTREKKEK